jgi:DNA-directed RNA polymerase specialized sigma24 family protein
MATPSGKRPLWWDREVDQAGRRIRNDVRVAALTIWQKVCAQTRTALGDAADASGLLESSVEQISRYLDRLGASPFSENAPGLLTVAFCRMLARRAAKLRRIKTVGDASEIAGMLVAPNWVRIANLRLDAEKIERQLSERGRAMVALKCAGYGWQYIAESFGISVSNAKSRFWREVKRAKRQVLNGAAPNHHK